MRIMTVPITPSLLLCLLLSLTGATFPTRAESPTRVLIITGGHGFQREPFFDLFRNIPDITFIEARHQDAGDAYDREDLLDHDVVILYDMVQRVTDSRKERFLSLFDHGVGLVVLHHAIVSHQNWPDYERVIGGLYPEPQDQKGVVTEALGYEHDVDIPVVIAARDHPVTRGLRDFILHDEIYWGYRVNADVTPLLTTPHERSGNPLAWARTEQKSRVVFIQPGHGPEAFKDPNYRRLIRQSIQWVKSPNPRPAWTPLLKGESLDGWVVHGGKARYRVEDGQIIGTSVPNTPNSFLCTEREYGNFILELEFKVHDQLNSGVQIRSHAFDHPTEFEWKGRAIKVAARRVHGLQVEIDPSDRAWTAGIQEEGGRSWLNNLRNNEPARQAFKAGQWNRLRIECHEAAIRTWLNGVPAADLKDDRTLSGFIGLQVHGVGDRTEPMEVRFRNLRLKELPRASATNRP